MIIFLKGGESSHKGGSPPFPTWQRPRFGNPACEVHAKSAQSDSFRAYRAEYANDHIFRHFQLAGLMPRCAVTNDNQNIVRKFIVQSIQKKLHTFCVTIWNHQKETFTRHRLNRTITYQYSRIWWHGTLGRCPLLHQQRFALLIRPNPASSWNIKRILFVGFWIAKSLTVSLIF